MAERPTVPVGLTAFILQDDTILTFDATLSESPTYAGTLTEHKIEGGGLITDHFNDTSDVLSLELYHTNDPNGIEDDTSDTRDFDMLFVLRDLKEAREPITVSTGMDVYFDMVIEKVSTSRSGGSGQALRFSIDLKRAVFTETATVEVPEAVRSLRSQRAEKGSEKGAAAADEVCKLQTSRSGEGQTAGEKCADDPKTPEQEATKKKETSLLLNYF